MDRRNFIQKMLASGLLVSSPPLGLLEAADQKNLEWSIDAVEIFMYDDYIKGFKYYEGLRLIREIKEENELELVREYDNPYDDSAIAVYWEGNKLGFLPTQKNEVIANLLDHGVLLKAEVVYTQPECEPWEMCFIAVRILMPSTPAFERYLENFYKSPEAGFRRRKEIRTDTEEDNLVGEGKSSGLEEKEDWEDYPVPD